VGAALLDHRQSGLPTGSKAEPFLLIVTGSLNSGDGDQIVSTLLVTYDIDQDAFRRVYGKSTGRILGPVGVESVTGQETAERNENSSTRTPEADEMIWLSARDSQVFVLSLSEPTPVNERLREAIRHYREATER
jgi:hypothetical protein